ncbi:hypothetical protein [Haloferula sp. A504]|uniref:hypothetical protein n=1 Tax=Haloferula sp. A504 TaxID=3373601 RepID=UPI0031C8D3EF|nr:hypothetical protein [Verrucomicrobiaceae bacterium E54]
MNSPDRAALQAQLDALATEVRDIKKLVTRLVAALLEERQFPDLRGASEIRNLEAGFMTRDQVQLIGCTLRVNHREVILSKRQAVLVSILMRHALAGDHGFISVAAIISEIETEFADEWRLAMPEDVHQVVYRIRRKLGLDRDLLETSPAKGEGIRLSTPAGHITRLKSPWDDRTHPCTPTRDRDSGSDEASTI